jgi:hypothetical protein
MKIPPVLVPVKKLLDWSPFSSYVWTSSVLTELMVSAAIENGEFVEIPSDDEENIEYHAKRVAWLVMNPTDDPIQIDVGCPVLRCHVDWIIMDGHHRLAAAIYRGDDTIPAHVSGQVSHAKELLGVKI